MYVVLVRRVSCENGKKGKKGKGKVLKSVPFQDV
jgi:hypothetical protein